MEREFERELETKMSSSEGYFDEPDYEESDYDSEYFEGSNSGSLYHTNDRTMVRLVRSCNDESALSFSYQEFKYLAKERPITRLEVESMSPGILTGYIQDFANLQYLDISCCNIERLPTINFEQLTTFKCSINRLKHLPVTFRRLEILYCDLNFLKKIPKIGTLKELRCDGNDIRKLPSFKKLEKLSCDRNHKLMSLPKMPNLVSLSCSETRISDISCFMKLSISLNISNTSISVIPIELSIKELYANNSALKYLLPQHGFAIAHAKGGVMVPMRNFMVMDRYICVDNFNLTIEENDRKKWFHIYSCLLLLCKSVLCRDVVRLLQEFLE